MPVPVSGDEVAMSTTDRMSQNAEADFSEFMWMADEDLEAFDNKVIQEVEQHMAAQLNSSNSSEEEEFLSQMLREEEERDTVYYQQYLQQKRNDDATADLTSTMNGMGVRESRTKVDAQESTLNPMAKEFVPTGVVSSQQSDSGGKENGHQSN
ncbi:unnamed protein product [Meganyctiphanes norvegica]|uniref:Ataxin-2 C-terminal domain-containing protein n=1 Tax=Meganyctiphanes norvegica TaxID=48144 RepID=A0AAV2RAQ6_MEGNR